MITDRAEYTANTGTTAISSENHSVDGTGALGTVLTASSAGTLIKTVTVKSSVVTTHGMIRLFVYDGSSVTVLVNEIEVFPTNTTSGIDHSFSKTIELNYYLKSGYILKAATYNAENFYVIADGLNWSNS